MENKTDRNSCAEVSNGYAIDLNGRMKDGKMEGNYNFTKDEIIANEIAFKIEDNK